MLLSFLKQWWARGVSLMCMLGSPGNSWVLLPHLCFYLALLELEEASQSFSSS